MLSASGARSLPVSAMALMIWEAMRSRQSLATPSEVRKSSQFGTKSALSSAPGPIGMLNLVDFTSLFRVRFDLISVAACACGDVRTFFSSLQKYSWCAFCSARDAARSALSSRFVGEGEREAEAEPFCVDTDCFSFFLSEGHRTRWRVFSGRGGLGLELNEIHVALCTAAPDPVRSLTTGTACPTRAHSARSARDP